MTIEIYTFGVIHFWMNMEWVTDRSRFLTMMMEVR